MYQVWAKKWRVYDSNDSVADYTETGSKGLGLCYLMTPGLSKDIQCHAWNLQIF